MDTDTISKEEVDAKPPTLFSIRWFRYVASALNYKKYDSRDWAIDTVSSTRSWAFAGGFAWLNVKFPWIWPLLKAAWGKVVMLFVATWNIVTGAI